MEREYAKILFTIYQNQYNEDWYEWFSEEIYIPFLEGKKLKIQLELNKEELEKYEEEISLTLNNLFQTGATRREIAKGHLFAYYQDIYQVIGYEYLEDMPTLEDGNDIYKYINISKLSISVSQLTNKIFAVYSGGCKWEPEHGITISFENGKDLAMVSDYGPVCNSDAYADIEKDKFIYIGNNIITYR